MGFFRDISIRRALREFREQWDRPDGVRWRVLALSAAITFAIVYTAVPRSERAAPQPPDVTFIQNFAPGRSDEEIARENLINQCEQDRFAALQEQRVERRREMYRALGQATGLDTDEMERRIAEERAAEGLSEEPEPKPYDCAEVGFDLTPPPIDG